MLASFRFAVNVLAAKLTSVSQGANEAPVVVAVFVPSDRI